MGQLTPDLALMYRSALHIAKDAHKGQTYKGKDYFEYHVAKVEDFLFSTLGMGPDYVFKYGHDAEYKLRCVALLHDALENSDLTSVDIAELFPTDVLEAIVLLTKSPNQSYNGYLTQLVKSGNDLAILVKKAELMVNLSHSLMTNDVRRIEKYTKVLQYISYCQAVKGKRKVLP